MNASYKGKRVFLTGHTGFKGGWLSLWLRELGAEVWGYSLPPPTEPSLFEAVGLAGLVNHRQGDVRDADALRAAVRECRPDIVFHLAAQPLVLDSYDDPLGTFSTNVMGTANLLEAVRRSDTVKAVVAVTSDKCYENREWVWGYREQDPMGGHDPYSASKGCAELVTAAYRRSFFGSAARSRRPVLAASARAGNVIGGGDWGKDRLVPDCMRALSRGEEVLIRAPAAVRPWQHVFEPLSGYLLLGARLQDGEEAFASGWNFGPVDFDTWTVREVVDAACGAWGGGRWVVAPNARPHEAHWLRLDASRAALELGWRPRWGVGEAITRTVAWYRKFYEGPTKRELLDFSLAELRRYESEERA